MNPQPLTLINYPEKVFEADEILREWSLEGDSGGIVIDAENDRSLDQVTARFHFIVPELMPAHDVLPIFSLRRDDSLILEMSYDRFEETIDVRMDGGELDSETVCVSLPGVALELICGRVLSCSLERSLGKAVVSIYDPFEADEFSYTAVGASYGQPGAAWGKPASGTWRVEIGSRSVDGLSCLPLPVGFGVCGLQVSLESEHEDLTPLAYEDALDHLRSPVWSIRSPQDPETESAHGDGSYDWDLDEPIEELLLGLAAQIDELSYGTTEWALRAQALSEEARDLALSVPEQAPQLAADPDLDEHEIETADDDDFVV